MLPLCVKPRVPFKVHVTEDPVASAFSIEAANFASELCDEAVVPVQLVLQSPHGDLFVEKFVNFATKYRNLKWPMILYRSTSDMLQAQFSIDGNFRDFHADIMAVLPLGSQRVLLVLWELISPYFLNKYRSRGVTSEQVYSNYVRETVRETIDDVRRSAFKFEKPPHLQDVVEVVCDTLFQRKFDKLKVRAAMVEVKESLFFLFRDDMNWDFKKNSMLLDYTREASLISIKKQRPWLESKRSITQQDEFSRYISATRNFGIQTFSEDPWYKRDTSFLSDCAFSTFTFGKIQRSMSSIVKQYEILLQKESFIAVARTIHEAGLSKGTFDLVKPDTKTLESVHEAFVQFLDGRKRKASPDKMLGALLGERFCSKCKGPLEATTIQIARGDEKSTLIFKCSACKIAVINGKEYSRDS